MPRTRTACSRSARWAATTQQALRCSAPRSTHLGVVDLRELRVGPASVVRGSDQGGAQQPVAGLAHWLALAVGLAGLAGPGRQPGEGPERLAGAEPGSPTDDRGHG